MIYFGAGQFLCTVLKLTHRIYYKNFINISFLTKYKLKIFFFYSIPLIWKNYKGTVWTVETRSAFCVFSFYFIFFNLYFLTSACCTVHGT